MKIKNKKGFTLIEVLVVVLIIGILAAVALPQYKKAVWKSRFAEVYTVTNALEKGMDVYRLADHSISEPVIFNLADLDVYNLKKQQEWYCSEYVCYQAACVGDVCGWFAKMYKNTSNTDDTNVISNMGGNNESDVRWFRYCHYEGPTANIGKTLCESTNWDDIDEGF